MCPRAGTRKCGCSAMAKVNFKLNLKGLNELMKSSEMQGILNQGAEAIAAAAGDGFEIEAAHPINFIAIASVYPATYKAKLKNGKHNILEKAKGSVKI